MSMPMEWDEPETEAVPLDLTLKKEVNYSVSKKEEERDDSGKLTEDAPLTQSSAQNGVESTPLNLSERKAFPLPPPPMSANVAQRATMVALSPKVQVKSSPQPQSKDHWTPASPSPVTATEHLSPLHGIYAGTATAVPGFFPRVLPTSTATQSHQHNQIQHQLPHLHMQQQHLLNPQHHYQLDKRQKYIENQIIIMYLTKKVKEMEDIKRRLLMANSNILAE